MTQSKTAAFAFSAALALLLGIALSAFPLCESAFAAKPLTTGGVEISKQEEPQQTANTYPIFYNLKGGHFEGAYVQTIPVGATYNTANLVKPVRVGYSFVGWYTNKKCTKKAKTVQGVAKASQRTLYAKWKEAKYSISYNAKGGKISGKRVKSYSSAKGVKTLPIAKKNGYAFMGWYFNTTEGTAHTSIPKGTKGKLKLYAKWQPRTLIAHRGYKGTGERANSADAFKAAALKGFTQAECDVRFTKDNVGVLSHDPSILVYKKDANGNKTGKPFYLAIRNVTYNQLQNNYIAFAPSGSRIYQPLSDNENSESNESSGPDILVPQLAQTNVTSFNELLDVCDAWGITPCIELKEGTRYQISKLMDEVDAHGMTYDVRWTSFTTSLLNHVRQRHPESRFILLANSVTGGKISTAKLFAASGGEIVLSVKASKANKGAVKKCAKAGIPLSAWTLADETQVKKFDKYICEFVVNKITGARVPARI